MVLAFASSEHQLKREGIRYMRLGTDREDVTCRGVKPDPF
jgi:hypothetical protein